MQHPVPLDYEVALNCWGLNFDESDGAENDEDPELPKPDKSAEPIEKPRQLKHVPDLGVELDFVDKVATIKTVLRGKPASRAGWNVGDELIALSDYRINQSSVWESALKQLPAGVATEAIISRRGRILSTVVTWDAAKPSSWKLKRLKAPMENPATNPSAADGQSFASEKQIQWRKQWLGQITETARP